MCQCGQLHISSISKVKNGCIYVYIAKYTMIVEWLNTVYLYKEPCSCKYSCFACMHAQSCATLFYPMDCSPSGTSDHGIFQVRILEWVAISSSRVFSWPRNQTIVIHIYVYVPTPLLLLLPPSRFSRVRLCATP